MEYEELIGGDLVVSSTEMVEKVMSGAVEVLAL